MSDLNAQEQDPNLCFNLDWPVHRYVHDKSGDTAIYEVPSNYQITSTNLACVVASEFVSRAHVMPNKMLVGLVSSDARRAFLARWDIVGNFFAFIEISIPEGEYRGVGMFNTYPEPLARIKNIITSTKFPTEEGTPIHLQPKLKSNNFNASTFQVRELLKTGTLQ